MFTKSPRDIERTLAQMWEDAYYKTNCNRSQMPTVIKEYVQQDRRFDGHDPMTVAKRYMDDRAHGRTFRLEEPSTVQRGSAPAY